MTKPKLALCLVVLIATREAAAFSTTEMDAINAGIRERAAAAKGEPAQAIRSSASNGTMSAAQAELKKSGQCSFSYYTFNDEKGKALASDASDECFDNGGRTGEAYNRWREHREQTKRRAAVAR